MRWQCRPHAGGEGTYRVGAGGAMHVAMGARVSGSDAGAGGSGSSWVFCRGGRAGIKSRGAADGGAGGGRARRKPSYAATSRVRGCCARR
jgi:hypothetical protein